MASKHPRYKINGTHLFQHSVIHKATGNFFIVPDDISLYTTSSPEVTKLRIGAANETVYYECDIETLISHIEDEMFELQVREGDGQEGFIVPIESSLFRKHGGVDKHGDSAWERQKKDIIKASGGPWSHEQVREWKHKFSAAANPKNKPVTGWYAKVRCV